MISLQNRFLTGSETENPNTFYVYTLDPHYLRSWHSWEITYRSSSCSLKGSYYTRNIIKQKFFKVVLETANKWTDLNGIVLEILEPDTIVNEQIHNKVFQWKLSNSNAGYQTLISLILLLSYTV